jgi:aminobenzoyl-glutamate utilization protein B
MLVAAKVLAASGVDLAANPKLVATAKEEWKVQMGGKPYVSPLASDAQPPVR